MTIVSDKAALEKHFSRRSLSAPVFLLLYTFYHAASMKTFSVCFERSKIFSFHLSFQNYQFFNCSIQEHTVLLSKSFSLSYDNAETPFLRLLWKNRVLLLHPNKKYYTQTADQEDLISIGTIGLIKGISTFNASKGARLATYAARCVENAILT